MKEMRTGECGHYPPLKFHFFSVFASIFFAANLAHIFMTFSNHLFTEIRKIVEMLVLAAVAQVRMRTGLSPTLEE